MAVENTVSSDFWSAFMRGSRGIQLWQLLLSWWGVKRGSKYHNKRDTNDPPAKRHMAQHYMLALYFVALWLFRGSGPVLLRKPYIFVIFQRGGGGSRSSVSDGVRQLLRTFSIAAYPVLGGTHNLVVVYMIVKLVDNLKRQWVELTDLITKSYSGKKITLFTNINEMTYSRWSWNYRRRGGSRPNWQKSLTFLYVF